VIRAIQADVNVLLMDPRLAYAVELEQRDAEVAARIEHVRGLGRRADEVRVRTEAVGAELAALHEQGRHVTAAAAEAAGALARAYEARTAAEREGQVGSGEIAHSNRLRIAGAVTDERAAAERHERLLRRAAELRRNERRLAEEADDVRRLAVRLAEELEREPRISRAAHPAGASLDALVTWSGRAHAAVLVARGGLEAERDKIVREANELASSVLGEALQAASAASVRASLERSLA
jgi:hypothetical protein